MFFVFYAVVLSKQTACIFHRNTSVFLHFRVYKSFGCCVLEGAGLYPRLVAPPPGKHWYPGKLPGYPDLPAYKYRYFYVVRKRETLFYIQSIHSLFQDGTSDNIT